ncbi:MAG: tyrosine-type recombinase/integrase [Alphaproteobacteria bacterium]
MAGKQAKILSRRQLEAALQAVRRGRHSERDRVIVLLSAKAGLRAGEIAALTWSMVLTPTRELATAIELQDRAAKKRSGRSIPVHPDLRRALLQLARKTGTKGHVVKSERGPAMTANSVVNWFNVLYRGLGFVGCSSHSGRRTFITRAARLVARTGGSLRDVQKLAGHRSISQTQAYIDADAFAQRRLVALI